MYKTITDCINLGTKDKLALLESVKDNETTRELFGLMLCPSTVYNIKKVPEGKLSILPGITTGRRLVQAIMELIDADLRGQDLINRLSCISFECTPELAKVLSWVIARKNPAKIGKTLVNKVWPGLVRTQEYMGAVPGTDDAITRLFKEAAKDHVLVNAQVKEDGMCLLVHYKDGIPGLGRTRQGNDFGKYFPGFMAELKSEFSPQGFTGTLHMELFVQDCARKTGNGLINKQYKNGTVGGELDDALCAVLLDMTCPERPDMTQKTRHSLLPVFTSDRVRLVEQRQVHTEQEAREYCQEVIAGGGEGLVLKHPQKPFKDGKPWFNVKMKNEFTVELECIGTKAHAEHADLIGSLVMQSGDALLEVNVNCKCNADRVIQTDMWIGEIFQVKAESVSTSKSKKLASLYLPRLAGGNHQESIRVDKNRANTLHEVMNEEAMSRGAK